MDAFLTLVLSDIFDSETAGFRGVDISTEPSRQPLEDFESVEFLEVDFVRPKCLRKTENLSGSFKRNSTNNDVNNFIDSRHNLKKTVDEILATISKTLRNRNLEDCTKYFE